MKKLIFKRINLDIVSFFITSLIILTLIVWTLQAIKFFDFVIEDGHGFRVYFYYTVLNFPKILSRILPFVFFISVFFKLLDYEKKNELNIFWIHGVKKKEFLNRLIMLSFIIMLIQIFISSYISPKFQFKARQYIKTSEVSFFTSLIKPKKFINITKGLTIFIEYENNDGSYSNIFIEDNTKNISRTIYATKGTLINKKSNKKFLLFNGKIINKKDGKMNIFDFETIDFDLNELNSKTITVPKIQEIDSSTLLGCFFNNITTKEFEAFICNPEIFSEIKQELFKRFHKPLYIPIILVFCCFLIIHTKKISLRKRNTIVFIATLILIIISEISGRYSSFEGLMFFIFITFPILLFLFSYLLLNKINQRV